MRIAIHDDQVRLPSGVVESYAARWKERAEASGCQALMLDAYTPDALEKIRGCDGFMCRIVHASSTLRHGKNLLMTLEHALKMPVYPDFKTMWHYDDKAAQAILLPAAGIPTPRTWVWYEKSQAERFARNATYPMVIKLVGGAGSSNVRLVHNASEALQWIDLLFGEGLFDLTAPIRPSLRSSHDLKQLWHWLRTGRRPVPGHLHDLHKDYVLLQEFLSGNKYDTRVTVIGDRAFGYRRNNRPNDFRASGSGLIEYEPALIDEQCVRLAFGVAKALGTQSIAIDGMKRGDEWVVGEISYIFVSQLIHNCHGHWTLAGDPASGSLKFHPGHTWPEHAIFDDFLARISRKGG